MDKQMNNINQLVEHLNGVENWDSDESFLRDAIALASAKLLIKCHLEVEDNNITFVAPLLRQVQENIIVISGLVEGVLTASQFVEKKLNPGDIMEAIENKGIEVEKNVFDTFNKYLKHMKNLLSKYSHTSFDGAMSLFTERFQVYESQQFNKIIMRYIISLIEAPFLVMVNYIYKLDLDLPKGEDFNKQLKELGTLKYISRQFPQKIKEFIKQSDVLRSYYLNMRNNFTKILQDHKDLKPL